MTEILLVGAGGFIGAVLRYLVGLGATHLLGWSFPFGTLFVNVIGCIVSGILVARAEMETTVAPPSLFIGIGILGSFTTFSALETDALLLFERRGLGLALLNVAANLFLGFLGLCLGRSLTRLLSGS